MPTCDNHFGECRKECHMFERAVAGGCGGDCTCCTSRPAVCPASKDTCAGTCIDGRFCPSHFQLSGMCSGDRDCVCCSSCGLMPTCDNHFGECRKQCHMFERAVAGGCGGDCTCCTSRPAVCPASKDTCAGTCIDGRFCPSHFQLSGMCSGDRDCVCCSCEYSFKHDCLVNVAFKIIGNTLVCKYYGYMSVMRCLK
ncbi:hypothetical protein Pmani_014260 [Petrolisthes manimaculis]|uniref:Uncharacterized protein n=1 Tax=Petrolisthes manimaculis TaxID=1843537 RepID=A0AAE1UB62_9EUCA|nr:hypothetical protein Pmani_014260 [Petrolisthes manimaculis]